MKYFVLNIIHFVPLDLRHRRINFLLSPLLSPHSLLHIHTPTFCPLFCCWLARPTIAA